MVVSQQEVVQTDLVGHSIGVGDNVGMQFINQDRDSRSQNNLQFIKSELENLDTEGLPLQISLDPIQIALNSVGEGITTEDNSNQYLTPLSEHTRQITSTSFSGDIITSDPITSIPLISSIADTELSCTNPTTPQDEAIKLLASHGITMLPEDPISPQSLSLTEAGKLALSYTSKTTSLSSSTLSSRQPQKLTSPRSISLSVPKSFSNPVHSNPKVTKVVTLNSSPTVAKSNSLNPVSSPVTFPKPPRVIKLTAEQFAAIKKGRAGQIVLPAMGGQNKKETITLASHMGIKREVGGNTALSSSSQPKKMIRLEPPEKTSENISTALNNMENEKLELQKQLQRQLEKNVQEAEKLKEETKKREQEAERIKAQLKALSN